MFVDERAMGEPYQPERQYRLPRRFFVGMLAPLPVAIFSFSIGTSYAIQGDAEAASAWLNVGDISLSLCLAVAIVAALRLHVSQSEQRGPPF